MAYSQDSTQSFTITLIGLLEGKGVITRLIITNATQGITYIWEAGIWTPGMPEAIEADSMGVQPQIENQGDTTDIIYGEFISPQVIPNEPSIQETDLAAGAVMGVLWTFNMPPIGVNIAINAGHVE